MVLSYVNKADIEAMEAIEIAYNAKWKEFLNFLPSEAIVVKLSVLPHQVSLWHPEAMASKSGPYIPVNIFVNICCLV
jgi:hypothetical protein